MHGMLYLLLLSLLYFIVYLEAVVARTWSDDVSCIAETDERYCGDCIIYGMLINQQN